MSFLRAEWRKLALANYAVDPDLLKPYLPAGTELDLWEGRCYLSLVGFMFLNTRLLGVKVPFHVNFEEVNLRFYVRRQVGDEWRRGVVFVKEIVPRPALSWVANTIYREHYETLPMKHFWAEDDEQRTVEYLWKTDGQWQSFRVEAAAAATAIAAGSEAEFITEHYWGYARIGPERTNEYEVTHPRWEQYAVHDFTIAVDFARVYGPEFAVLDVSEPVSVMLAEGSLITVESKRSLSFPASP
jgi:uncharacterized protein YqjF (DUF2071 family)